MKRYLIVLVIVLMACGGSSEEVSDVVQVEEETTTTTTIKETTLEEPKKEEIETIRYRGVLRRSMYQNVPLVYSNFDTFEQKKVEPQHEYSEDFYYDIRIPVINEDIACSDVVNTKINTIVERLVEEKKSILDLTTPEEAEEEWGGFAEYLTIKYDIIEISDEVISIFISNETYSFGAAHFISYTESINIFTEDCSDLNVVQLFDSSNDDYDEILESAMQNQLCAVLTSDECTSFLKFAEPFPTLEELTECCSAVAVSQFGIFIQFWEYEVSSFSEGSELILLPWHYISNVIEKNGKYSNILKSYSERTYLNSVFEPEWSF